MTPRTAATGTLIDLSCLTPRRAATGTSTGGPASQGSATPHANGSTASSLASQSFALLNQYLAGSSGRVDPGQIVAAVSKGTGCGQDAFLTRPQH